jgi:hypothetical protein
MAVRHCTKKTAVKLPRAILFAMFRSMRTLSRRVGACLRNLRKKKLVMMTRPPGSLGLWQIAD